MTTPDELVARKELANRIWARRRLLAFIQRLDPAYLAGWVHEDICRRLERFSDDVAKGLSPRLMILMPPRHGKSRIASMAFPAWHLGRHPNHEFIAASYNVGLAMGFSRKAQAVMNDPRFPFEVKLDPNNQSAESWGLQGFTGGYVAAGVGGGITGKGAHILTIDDPIKNAEEADSLTTREALSEWYGSTAYTRLAPGGGVLLIQCMTGDTPVLLPDGTEKRLDAIRAGDVIATYENSRMTAARVVAWRSNGSDNILKITTKSGKIVRANGRHPFLATTITGELKWIRVRSLSTANKIVTVKGSEESGSEWSALLKGAQYQLGAVECVTSITPERSGRTDTAHHPITPKRSESGISNTDMGSPQSSTPRFLPNNKARAPYVREMGLITPEDGSTDSPSITAMKVEKFVDCSATIATSQSDILELSPSHLPLHGTSDFTLDEIVSIEPDGEEEVFDVQIDRTTNFIANGVVASNTCWHDDDLAGRLQQAMQADLNDPDVDRFEIVKYPAIAEADEWIDSVTDEIVRVETKRAVVRDDMVDPAVWSAKRPAAVNDAQMELVKQLGFTNYNLKLLRVKGEPLHPQRYDLTKLARIRKALSNRFWSALYQQNPVPDDGSYFLREQFKRDKTPDKNVCNVFLAFDFAITEKQANDYTVGTVGLQDYDDTLHVADMVRFKTQDSSVIVEAIITLIKKWRTTTLRMGFENGQIFLGLEMTLKKRMREERLFIPYEVLQPTTDKKVRASPFQARMQHGRVAFKEGAEWFPVMQNEMLRFPSGIHDDIVDSLAWMARLVTQYEPPRKPTPKAQKSWRDKIPGMGRRNAGPMAA